MPPTDIFAITAIYEGNYLTLKALTKLSYHSACHKNAVFRVGKEKK